MYGAHVLSLIHTCGLRPGGRSSTKYWSRYLQCKALSPKGNEYSETIKKSKFVCIARPVTSADQANEIMDEFRDSNANHHCWAYRIGLLEKCSDDGEPSGSAGFPILAAIKGQQLQNTFVMVVRYFGGVKLGVGGLIRAYGGIARKCLSGADYVTLSDPVLAEVTASIVDVDKVYSALRLDRSMTIIHERIDGNTINLRLQLTDKSSFQRIERYLNSSMKGCVAVQTVTST